MMKNVRSLSSIEFWTAMFGVPALVAGYWAWLPTEAKQKEPIHIPLQYCGISKQDAARLRVALSSDIYDVEPEEEILDGGSVSELRYDKSDTNIIRKVKTDIEAAINSIGLRIPIVLQLNDKVDPGKPELWIRKNC